MARSRRWAPSRLGKRTESLSPKIKDFVPLADLNDLVFTGWDIFEDDMYAAAGKAGVLERSLLEQVKPFLSGIKPRKAVFDKNYVKKLDGTNVKKGKNKMELAEQLRQDIREFKRSSGAERLVMIWCASTETFHPPRPSAPDGGIVREGSAGERREHRTFDDLRVRGIAGAGAVRQRRAQPDGRYSGNVGALTQEPSSDLRQGLQNGTDAAQDDSGSGIQDAHVPGLSGWFSTNILGNRDGEVLDDPGSFKTKEESKLSVLEHILQPEL